MKESLQNAIQDELPDANFPDFEPGDEIKVTTTEMIGGQQRERQFEGVCIARKGKGPDRTFKVRKMSFGVGVERIFPLHSPIIDEIEILRKGKVRRAKLNYLEGLSSKESRIDEERVDLEELNRTQAGVAGAPDDEDVTSEDDEEPKEQTEDDPVDQTDADESLDDGADADTTETSSEPNAEDEPDDENS